jgi:hypothetical protein
LYIIWRKLLKLSDLDPLAFKNWIEMRELTRSIKKLILSLFVRDRVYAHTQEGIYSELRVAKSADRTNMRWCCVTRKYGFDPLRPQKS